MANSELSDAVEYRRPQEDVAPLSNMVFLSKKIQQFVRHESDTIGHPFSMDIYSLKRHLVKKSNNRL